MNKIAFELIAVNSPYHYETARILVVGSRHVNAFKKGCNQLNLNGTLNMRKLGSFSQAYMFTE